MDPGVVDKQQGQAHDLLGLEFEIYEGFVQVKVQ